MASNNITRFPARLEHIAQQAARAEKIGDAGIPPHNGDMDTITPLLTAKLEATEARMDARVDRIELRCDRIESDMQDIKSDMKDIKSDMKDIKSEMKSIKWWMMGTGLSVVIGIAAFNATVLSNMVASFESGKNTATQLAATDAQLKAREQRLDKIEQQLDKLLTQPAPAPR